MRNQISSILLLIVYLVLVSHHLVHHHHFEEEIGNSANPYLFVENHDHVSNEIHHDHDSEKTEKDHHKGHDHDFPMHHHFNSEIGINKSNQGILKFFNPEKGCKLFCFIGTFNPEKFKPPEIRDTRFELSFFVLQRLNKEAISFRGPPAG